MFVYRYLHVLDIVTIRKYRKSIPLTVTAKINIQEYSLSNLMEKRTQRSFFFFVVSPMAYGGSQARGVIRDVATGPHHSSEQHWIPNPLSEARDCTHNLMVPSQIRFCCAMTGTPKEHKVYFFSFWGHTCGIWTFLG